MVASDEFIIHVNSCITEIVVCSSGALHSETPVHLYAWHTDCQKSLRKSESLVDV